MDNNYLNTSIGTFGLEAKGNVIPFNILFQAHSTFQNVDLAVYLEPEIPSNFPVDEFSLSSDIKGYQWKHDNILSGENLWGGDFLNYDTFNSLSISMISNISLNKSYPCDVIHPMYKVDEKNDNKELDFQNFKYTDINPESFNKCDSVFGFGISIKKYTNIQSLCSDETSLATFYLL